VVGRDLAVGAVAGGREAMETAVLLLGTGWEQSGRGWGILGGSRAVTGKKVGGGWGNMSVYLREIASADVRVRLRQLASSARLPWWRVTATI